jgi:hypothetical protein
MKILYYILAIACFLVASMISYFKATQGNQMDISQIRANNPFLTSLIPINHPLWLILGYALFIKLASRE